LTTTQIDAAVTDATKGISDKFDLPAIRLAALQELCMENRWWFRRKYDSFTTVAGTQTYDLPETAGGDMDDVDEIKSLWWRESATDITEIDFVDDDASLVSAINNSTNDRPSLWMHEPDGAELTIRLSPPPESAKTVYVVYWAIPNISADDSSTTIPLLPARYHWILQKRMEMTVWELAPGEGVESPHFMKAAAIYKNGLEMLKKRNNLSVQKVRHFSIPQGDPCAVQSS
jgi:hypothetical protein